MTGGGGGDSGSEPSESDGDNSSPTGGPLSAQPPQELSSSELDGERAEPVCRAKSIYVSPRAAVSTRGNYPLPGVAVAAAKTRDWLPV